MTTPNKLKHDQTKRKEKSGEIMAKSSKGKSDVKFWESRLVRLKVKGWESPDFQVRISHAGRREYFNTKSPNKKAAAARAKEFYQSVVGSGWEAALLEFKPEAANRGKVVAPVIPEIIKEPTVGDLISTVTKFVNLRPATLQAYTKALRKITGDLFPPENRRYPAGPMGKDGLSPQEKWRAAIDAVPLSWLTKERIEDWKLEMIRAAGDNPVKKKSALITATSLMRNARGLISRDALERIEGKIALPSPLPFAGMRIKSPKPTPYDGKFDAAKLLRDAREELEANDLEAYKALIFGLLCGLTRSEIDKLQWDAVRFKDLHILIEISEHNPLKNTAREGKAFFDESTAQVLKKLKTDANAGDDDFVLISPIKARPYSANSHYRANRTFTRLLKWLRAHGVPPKTPIHTLRKECGSLVTAAHGLHVAKGMLRHSTIRTTESYYADQRRPESFALGGSLGLVQELAKEEGGANAE